MSAIDIITLNMIATSVGTIVGALSFIAYDWWRSRR
jgi:hypothetical protein